MDPRELAARGAHDAAAAGDVTLLRQWVGASPSSLTLNAALCGAARGNHVEILRWLLSCGVVPVAAYDGISAREWAEQAGAVEAGRILDGEDCEPGTSQEPAWFRTALGVPRREGSVELGGRNVHWIEWGERGAPPIAFAHGFVGHAEWWSFIAPFLAGKHHCVALDLSGHGESSWAGSYSREDWSDEIDAVLDAAGAAGDPVIVGHSMGGIIALATAARRSPTLRGIVIVDSPMRPPEPPPGWSELVPWREAAPTHRKVYPTLDEAITHFRLVPPQPVLNTVLFEHVARCSVREVEGGWAWKFDPSMFARRQLTPTANYLETASCPIALVTAEHSMVVDLTVPEYRHLIAERRVPHVEIPDCHHHLLIDQPLALVATLRTLCQTWEAVR